MGWYDPVYQTDSSAPNGRMVDGWAREVSLVDAGANHNAHIKGFVVAKSESKGLPPELFGVGGAPSAMSREEADALAGDVGEGGSRIARALKAAQQERALKALAASQWYAAFKRDIDPDVGGGVDRDKLDDSDFVIVEGEGDDKKRKFPVVTPGDVSDAVSSWGRYKGPMTFEEFKAKLTALCKRKGPSFVAELPDSWDVKKGSKMARDKAQPDNGDGAGDDKTKVCPTCDGKKTILEGNRKCPDCQDSSGKPTGRVPLDFKKARKALAVKGETDDAVSDGIDQLEDAVATVGEAQAVNEAKEPSDADEEVDDALDDVADAVDELAQAQADDEAEDAAAEAGNGDDDADKAAPKARSAEVKRPKARKAKPPKDNAAEMKQSDASEQAEEDREEGADGASDSSSDGDGDGDGEHPKGCKCGKCKAMRKAGKKERATKQRQSVPAAALATHDALCPAFAVDAATALKAIDPSFFALWNDRARRDGDDRTATAAYKALSAAMAVTSMPLPSFERIRTAAHKALSMAYPDLTAAGFMLRSPDQFRRPFLSGATPEVDSGPNPLMPSGMATTFGPGDFDRLSQIANEARPSPTPGSSAASLMGKGVKRPKRKGKDDSVVDMKPPKNARVFYTNNSKDEHAAFMGQLHDLVSKHYPGICPMHGVASMPSDGDKAEKGDIDLAGLKPSAGMPKPAALPEPPGADTGKLTRPTGTENVGKGKAPKASEKDAEVKRLRKALKSEKSKTRKDNKYRKLKGRMDKFTADVKAQLKLPDQRRAKQRGPGAGFRPIVNGYSAPEEAVARAKSESRRLKGLLHSHDPRDQQQAIEAARETLPADQFAQFMLEH